MRLFAVLLAMVAACGIVPAAQAQGLARLPSAPASGVSTQAIKIDADSFEYNHDRTLVIGRGNVSVVQGDATLKADYMTVNQETGEIFARGNVSYVAPDKTWQGEQFTYNFKEKHGTFGKFDARIPPYYITAEDSEQVSSNKYVLKGVTVTTCDGKDPEFVVRMGEATLTDNRKIDAQNVKFIWNGVPFLWLPTFSRVLDSHDAWFEIIPGYSSRHGAFALSAYNIKLNRELLSTTHLDYRSKRGIGVGQDFRWEDSSHEENWAGEVRGYYLNDQKPFRDAKEEEEFGNLVDEQRYRLKFSHRQTLSERDYFIGNLNYLSDPNVLDDFFNDEYRSGVQPENRLTLMHRGDTYAAGIEFNRRLNDFYENVDRMPDLTLNVFRQRLGDSDFYYESQNSASYLEHVFPDGATTDNYDAFRVDSRHMIYYPTRHFGFLNFTPRAGYQGTFYSSTYDIEKSRSVDIQQGSNGVTIATNVADIAVDGGSGLRSLPELGFETSFKAFKAWDDYIILDGGDGIRHVAEPYLNYTYIPEPELRPVNLPQFDRIDALDLRHDIRIGMRNKLQTRYDRRVWDVVDANVWTYYRIEKANPALEDFDYVFFNIDNRPTRTIAVDFDGAYDEYNNEFDQFATQIAYVFPDESRIGTEYRYRRDGEDFISPFISLFPHDKIGFDAEWRHDLNLQRLEEHRYLLRYNTSCLSYGFGFRQADDDIQGWLQVSLLAFPNSRVDLGK